MFPSFLLFIISEVSVAQYRGRLVSLYQLAVTVGFLGAYLVNYQLLAWAESGTQLSVDWLNKVFITEVWRGMLGMETLPAILFFIIIFFIPESPRWLIVRGKDLKAVNILERICNSITEAKSQLKETKSVLTSETKSEWAMLMKPGIFKAVIIGVCIAILGQFMGVNAVLYYGPSIFENAGLSGGDSLFYQVLVGLVNTLTTVLALVIIDRVGRKQLVYYGVSGMVVSLLLIGIYFLFGDSWGSPASSCSFSSCSMYSAVPSPSVPWCSCSFRRCTPPRCADWRCPLQDSPCG